MMKLPRWVWVKVWEEGTGRMRRFFLRKPIVIFGSDKKSDIQLKKLQGLDFQMNFETGRILSIASGSVTPWAEGSIKAHGPYALTWSVIPRRRLFLSAMAAILGITLSAIALWGSGGDGRHCDLDQVDGVHSFRKALKLGHFVRAQAELFSLEKNRASAFSDSNACSAERALAELASDFERTKFLKSMPEKDLSLVISEFKGLKLMRIAEREMLKRQVLGRIRARYLEGYRLEDEDPSQSFDLITSAQRACSELEMKPDCFRLGDEET